MLVSIARAQDYFLVLTRLLAILSAVPVLGGRTIPAQVRLGLGLLLAAVIIPSPIPVEQVDNSFYEPLMPYLWDVARELITGILAGTALRLAFMAFEVAAIFMGQSVGFSAGTLLNPAFDSSSTAFDQLYTLCAILLFLVIDGHHQVLQGVARTFTVVPLRSLALTAGGEDQLIRLSAGMFLSAAQMALPVVAVMLLLDVAFGLVARVAPQVNIFFIEAPAKMGVGLLTLSAVMPLLIPAMTTLFDRMTVQMVQLIR